MEEEKRLDDMMEVERLRDLQYYEERERLAHRERLHGAEILKHQILEKEQIRLLEEEQKDQEKKVGCDLESLLVSSQF